MVTLVNKIFRVDFMHEGCWDSEGDFIPYNTKTKDFKVASKALVFATGSAKQYGAAILEHLDIMSDKSEQITTRWEVYSNGSHFDMAL